MSLQQIEKINYTKQNIKTILENPHLIGTMIGKDKSCELHSRWIKHIWLANQHTGLMAHRGSFKTTNVLEIGTVWFLLFNPNARIGLFRKTFTEASKSVLAIRNMMKLPVIQSLFESVYGHPLEFTKERDGELCFNFKKTITKESNIEAHGWDYNVTGSHYDKIIADDFVTMKDKLSKAEREKTKEVLREMITNIIDPNKFIGFIGTPWHKKDAWEELEKEGVPIKKYDVFQTGFLSDKEIEKKKKHTTPVLFNANYLIKHISDKDRLFQDPHYGNWQYTGLVGEIVAQVDASFQGTHTSGFTIMVKKESGRYQALGKVDRGNIKNWISKLVTYLEAYRVKYIYVESNPDKGYTADKIEAELLDRGVNCEVVRYNESENKHNKISTKLFEFWDMIDWDGQRTEDEYMEQILDYMKGQEPDDCPDSCASLIKMHFYQDMQKFDVNSDPAWNY